MRIRKKKRIRIRKEKKRIRIRKDKNCKEKISEIQYKKIYNI